MTFRSGHWAIAGLLLYISLPLPAAQLAPTGRIDFGGDFRLRWESLDQQGSPTRERGRYRTRLNLSIAAADDIDLHLQVATGSGSPVSTNLDFGDGFTSQSLRLARAYVDWRVNEQWHLLGGKMKAPWFRPGGNGLVWDGDLNPEGIAAMFRRDRLFASFAVLVPDERAGDDDSILLTAQGGLDVALGGQRSLVAGLGWYDYSNTAGKAPFYDGKAKGNSVDADGNYLHDYSLVELFAEYRWPIAGRPLAAYASWITNGAADDEDQGYVLGVTLGSAAKAGGWQVGYSWRDTDADAVVGTYNNSDFGGGNSDSRGHELKGRWAWRDNVQLGATLIRSEFGAASGNERDYDRLMLDIEFSFE